MSKQIKPGSRPNNPKALEYIIDTLMEGVPEAHQLAIDLGKKKLAMKLQKGIKTYEAWAAEGAEAWGSR